MLGTGLLLFIGLSLVTEMFGTGKPYRKTYTLYRIPQTDYRFSVWRDRRALIAISPIGKVSGAHINAVVTMAFFLFKKINAEPR